MFLINSFLSYTVVSLTDFEKAIATHCQRYVESAIREKLDVRAVRVFRLLMQKGFLEEDHVSFELAMTFYWKLVK